MTNQSINVKITPLIDKPYQLLKQVSIDTEITGQEINNPQVKLNLSGVLTIKRGYQWDGATGAVDTRNFTLASLVHDALYELMRKEQLPREYKEKADDLLISIAKANGMGKVRRSLAWLGVTLFGHQHTF